MSAIHFIFSALLCQLAHAQPGQCDQTDGDYPGCGLSKLTHSSSQPQVGKAFMEKYFPVQTPGDECTDDVCDCSADSSHAAWHIYQGRVYTTREVSPSGGGGGSPGNGFGLHLVNVPDHLTTGGLTTEQVEAKFAAKLGDMTKFDSFMDYNAVFATSGLQNYKDSFKADGVKYLSGTWSDTKGTQYTSVIVQVPQSQLILELCQKGSLTYEEGDMQPVKLEQRVPDSTLATFDTRLTARSAGTPTVGAYLVALGINHAASAKAMAQLEDFYVTGMGTTKTHDTTEDGVTKKCFLWPGATGNLCFTSRPDDATAGDWKVGDFEDMLNTVHTNLLKGHPLCPVDKWFDNHYAIDSQSADTSKILSYVNEKNPLHICASGMSIGTDLSFPPSSGASLRTIVDPTGWSIQLDMQAGTPNDCSSAEGDEEAFNSSSRRLQGGKFNPACTTDNSKCGGGGPSPTPTPPTPPPSPPSPPPPSPPSPPSPPAPANCNVCAADVGSMCNPGQIGFYAPCMNCVYQKRAQFTASGCSPPSCMSQLQASCAPPPTVV